MEAESSKAAGEAANSASQDTQIPTPPSEEAGNKAAKSRPADTKSKPKSGKKSTQISKKNEKNDKRTAKKNHKEDTSSESELSHESDSDDESSEDERAKKKKKAKVAVKKATEKKKTKLNATAKAKKGKGRKVESSDESQSEGSESDSSSESESEHEKVKRKKKSKARAKNKSEYKKYKISTEESSSSSSSSSSDTDSEAEKKKKKRKKAKAKAKANVAKKRSKKAKAVLSDSSASSTDTEVDSTAATEATSVTSAEDTALVGAKKAAIAQLQAAQTAQSAMTQPDLAALAKLLEGTNAVAATNAQVQIQPKKNALEFKRVDQVWDSKIRDYKYTESVEEVKDEFDCVFTVRRRFGWDNKYLETMVDIKSKVLRGILQEVFKDCKSVSLVEDKPSIHPHFLFHYYDEIKTYVKKPLKLQLKKAKKRKERKTIEQQIRQGQLMLKYIDEDYEQTRKKLKSMLKAGTITYDLVWALFKPNTIAYTPTYGNKDDPRCFKVDYCYEQENWMTDEKNWMIEGRYLEYDGKVFGFGEHYVAIRQFRGSRKIANLSAYPLEFHEDPEKLTELLIERGKKFVSLRGMKYMRHDGLGYVKHKNTVRKNHINGRVMIDPAIFRRLIPNYPLSYIKHDELGQDDDEEDEDSDCGCDSGSGGESEEERPKMRTIMWRDKSGKRRAIRVPNEDDAEDITAQKLDTVSDDDDDIKHVFTEEELLIASPVVLGFAFSEKTWLEFSLLGISEIKWQPQAFESLVLPAQIKQNLKGLVSSHRFNAAKTIDDVIVGKGKGLNVVLHGPPGVGKTLTGESIAEFLRCPLYMVSSGELGTSAGKLEQDLNRIMEITHAWGAILLLDEADVFLEARQPHDIHRNALVSVFLRLTEYYQGILFLTTNRIATFDEAFQSRIHMGIRYEQLSVQSRKKIWMHYVSQVLAMDDGEGKTRAFADSDFDELSRKVLNGRQIKNAVKTSQAIALSEKGVFGMDYVKRIMESHETFEEDMRGGRGHQNLYN
ncbi:hypothetical protein BU23DRAFT_479942 [Bimuria novae-zelandiae CBS 107.79]|uniref:AAA+ ATPase domain-containing protein n=1 Tax=Bimuria novae-zelandiae CBS 107.79 TaxID=1447943 RepID=A0A6A5V0D7_9PLEO|nr:hypothetical protein BU23DRAFT_479942 [Bimuria novae-zelandiae CBS 107.79]